MNRQELIKKLINDEGVRRNEAIKAVNGFTRILFNSLQNGESVYLYGLGTLKVSRVKEKKTHITSSGEDIVIPAHKVVKFIPNNELKNKLKA